MSRHRFQLFVRPLKRLCSSQLSIVYRLAVFLLRCNFTVIGDGAMSWLVSSLKRLIRTGLGLSFRVLGSSETRLKAAIFMFNVIERSMPLGYTWKLREDIITRSQSLGLIPSHVQARIHGMFEAINNVATVPGDIVECGVGYGSSLSSLVYAVSHHRLDKTVYGFDSFSGFPKAQPQDNGPRAKQNVAPLGWDGASPSLIREIFINDSASNGFSLLKDHDVKVVLVPGFFEETLAENLPEKISFLHIDVDLYESTRLVLEIALPRVSPGGIVIFDEYMDERWPGATRAIDEFIEISNLSIEYFPHQKRYGVVIPE